MTKWIWCKHPVNPKARIAVNLDQVVSLTPVRGGARIRYVGSAGKSFLVANTPDEILNNQDFDSA